MFGCKGSKVADRPHHGNRSQRTTAVYGAVSVTALGGLLDQTKTRLAELRSVTSPLALITRVSLT